MSKIKNALLLSNIWIQYKLDSSFLTTKAERKHNNAACLDRCGKVSKHMCNNSEFVTHRYSTKYRGDSQYRRMAINSSLLCTSGDRLVCSHTQPPGPPLGLIFARTTRPTSRRPPRPSRWTSARPTWSWTGPPRRAPSRWSSPPAASPRPLSPPWKEHASSFHVGEEGNQCPCNLQTQDAMQCKQAI